MATPVIERVITWGGSESIAVSDGSLTTSDKIYIGDMGRLHVVYKVVPDVGHGGGDGTTIVLACAEDGTPYSALVPISPDVGTLEIQTQGRTTYSSYRPSKTGNTLLFEAFMKSLDYIAAVFGPPEGLITVSAKVIGRPL